MLATIVVTSIQDNTSVDGFVTLREALIAAETDAVVDGSVAGNGSDTITFAPSLTDNGPVAIYLSIIGDGTAGPSALGITTNVSIVGPTTGSVTLIEGRASMRAFYVAAEGNLTISNLTLSSFRHNGGDSHYGGGAAGMGGAIFANGGSVTILASTLINNIAQGGSAIASNGALGGGGLGGSSFYEGGGPNGGYNSGGGFGGGGSGGTNFGGFGFGGGFGGGGGGDGGFGGFGGGGGGGNNGGYGGGISGSGVILGVGRGGGGAGMGGAIFNNGGSISIVNSTFAGNSALGGTSFNGRGGQGLGGVIFARNGSVTINNSTLSDSTAANGGRGLYVLSDTSNGGNNTSPGTGNATATINNTIIGQADNTVSDFVAATNGDGTPRLTTSGIGNLIRTAVNFSGTIVSTADLLLGALANNGGPTATFALLAASPAINAGSNANIPNGMTTDQRGAGFARTNGSTVDSGAFEAAVAAPAVMSPTVTDVTANSATLGGTVTTDNGEMISERGILVSKTSVNANPQLNDIGVTKITATGTTGIFTVNATSLDPLTGYSYIAFATNFVGTTYSAVSTFTTQPAIGQFPGITVQIIHNVLIVTSTEQDDTIKIASDGQGGVVVTSNQLINGLPSPQIYTGATSIVVNTLGGNDDLWLAAPLTISSLAVDLGNGNDRLVLGADPNNPINNNVTDAQFGTLGYLTVNGPLQVTGGEGDDRVIERSTSVAGAKTISLGEGNNEYNVYWSLSNETIFSSGGGADNVYIGYLSSYQASQFDTGAGNDLISYYASRFYKTAYLNSGTGYDTVALDVNIYDEAATVDTGSEAGYLLFSRSVAYKSVALTTGNGADTILIGKYISGLDNLGRAIYSNGGSNIDQFTLYSNGEVDTVQIAANVMRLFYANLGDANDDAVVEYNLFTDGLLDGGTQGTRLKLTGNKNLRTRNPG